MKSPKKFEVTAFNLLRTNFDENNIGPLYSLDLNENLKNAVAILKSTRLFLKGPVTVLN